MDELYYVEAFDGAWSNMRGERLEHTLDEWLTEYFPAENHVYLGYTRFGHKIVCMSHNCNHPARRFEANIVYIRKCEE